MRSRLVPLVAFIVLSCQTSPQESSPQATPSTDPSAMHHPADPNAAERAHEVQEVLASIAGKEKLPAEQVFKNIQIMKGVPAARLLAVMNVGFGASLGVSCDHCHVHDEWDSDEKEAKKIARDMSIMTRRINNELLKSMSSLGDRQPAVNCTTCHRGQIKPALSMGE